MKRILVALALLLSGLAYGQTTTKKVESICGYKFTEITELLKPSGSEFSYKSTEIVKQLDSGFFDNTGVTPLELKDARKMCILLYELTGLENKTTDASVLAKNIVTRYGAYTGKTVAKSESDLTAAIKSGKALQIINNFWKSTARIWTTKLPEYYKTYEPTVYNDEYDGSMTAEAARNKLATQIDSFVTDYPTQEKLVTITVDNTITQAQLDAEGEYLYSTKSFKVRDLASAIKGKKSCTEISALSEYLNSIVVVDGKLVLSVSESDGTVKKVKKENAVDYPNGVYASETYTLTGKDLDPEALLIATNNPTVFKGVKTWKELVAKVETLVAACSKTKKKSTSVSSDSDLDGIIAAGNSGSGTWFSNWDLCNKSTASRDGLTATQTCQQVILEGDYDEDNDADLSKYNLSSGNLIEEIKGEKIDQLTYYLDSDVTVKNERKLADQDGINIDDNKGLIKDGKFDLTKATDDNMDTWKTHNDLVDQVVKAETAMANMKDYLLTDFYNGDAVKNICFGFPVSTAAATNGTKAMITDLTKAATADETIAFFKASKVINVSAGDRSIQQLCVIFNRVKKASVTGLKSYKDFAGLIVDTFELNTDIDVKTTVDQIEVTGKEAFKVLFANIMEDKTEKTDESLIRLLSCLKGFGDIHNDYVLGETSEDYTRSDAITNIIVASSVAGEAVVTPTITPVDNNNNSSIVNNNNSVSPNNDNSNISNNNNSNNPVVSSDVSTDLNNAIIASLGTKLTDAAADFNTSMDAIEKLITKDLDLTKYKSAIAKALRDAIKAYDAIFWSTDKDDSLDEAILLAFSTPFKSVDSWDDDLAAAINADTKISAEVKTRLTAKGTNGLYSSLEFIALAKARVIFELGKYTQTSLGSTNTIKPRREMTNSKVRRTVVERGAVTTTSTVSKTPVTKRTVTTKK